MIGKKRRTKKKLHKTRNILKGYSKKKNVLHSKKYHRGKRSTYRHKRMRQNKHTKRKHKKWEGGGGPTQDKLAEQFRSRVGQTRLVPTVDDVLVQQRPRAQLPTPAVLQTDSPPTPHPPRGLTGRQSNRAQKNPGKQIPSDLVLRIRQRKSALATFDTVARGMGYNQPLGVPTEEQLPAVKFDDLD